MKMIHLNSLVKEGIRHLKALPDVKVNQLNHCIIPSIEQFHYDCFIIHVGINNIIRSTDVSRLKDLPKNNIANGNNLSKL